MKKITSFTVNHTHLLPGIYVSRKDSVGKETVTTFDLRMKRPNREPVLNNAELHTLEHLGATYLRNEPEWMDRVLYFGPMGCRTGFYLLLAGDYEPEDAADLVTGMFEFIADFEGEIPGARPEECGNYLDQNLEMARYESREYLKTLHNLKKENMVYPTV